MKFLYLNVIKHVNENLKHSLQISFLNVLLYYRLITTLPYEAFIFIFIFINKSDDIICHGTLPRIADNDGILFCFDTKTTRQMQCKWFYFVMFVNNPKQNCVYNDTGFSCRLSNTKQRTGYKIHRYPTT